ncbi:dihydroorotate dehydrogenase [Rhodococcus koreensis]|uniref:dihydroorotate dehydrogenase n=1 Tax=Rhodococcus koreensis TaxID=99653 RepID=UPI003670EAE9
MSPIETTVAGFTTKNPIWVGSSEMTMSLDGIRACIDAGAGAVIAKSINESQAARDQLDIADYAFLTDNHHRAEPPNIPIGGSLFNRSGLAQSSLDDWLTLLERGQDYARSAGSIVIGSITAADPRAAGDLARALSDVVPAVEVNVGAPHGREAAHGAVRQLTDSEAVGDLVRTVRRDLDAPLLVKLPGMASDIGSLVDAAHQAGADAITLTGRFNGFLPSVQTHEPLLGSWGAYGGSWALPMSLYAVSKAYHAHRGAITLIGTNGARTADDVIRFILSGASAVELVSLLWIRGPQAITELVDRLRDYLDANESTVSELRGKSVALARTYADIAPISPRPEPWTTPSP